MEEVEITITKNNDEKLVAHIFGKIGELKAIVDDDYTLIIKEKDPSNDEPNS